jgi:hypothetical protein
LESFLSTNSKPSCRTVRPLFGTVSLKFLAVMMLSCMDYTLVGLRADG